MKKRIESLENKFDSHLDAWKEHQRIFKERGENHKKNNEAFVDLTATINQLSNDCARQYALNQEQAREITILKTAQLSVFEDIKAIKTEFKEFGKEIVTELKTINETLTLQRGGRATLNWLGKLIFQLVAFSATLIAVVKFILEQN